jgi:hypothetical protein
MEKYPIDTEELIKGSVVSVTECEKVLGERYGTTEYNLGLMGLVGFIYQEMFSKGLIVTIRTVKGEIHVLEDAAASKHNDKMIQNHIKGIKIKTGRLLAVDVNNLTIAEKAKHDRRCLINSKILQAITNTRKQFKVNPSTRRTPTLKTGE